VDIRALLAEAQSLLATAGVTSAGVDAEILLATVSETSRGELLAAAYRGESIGGEALAKFRALLARRQAREPLQHITGRAPFMNFEVAVGPGVFVPRPETQSLVEAAINQALASGVGERGLRILDLCSGSGVVAISLARALPYARVVAVEMSEAALPYLRNNVVLLAPEVEVVHSDVASYGSGLEAGSVDMVLANPPYVPDSQVPNELEVATHDPALALFGGEDGLRVVRDVVALALKALRPGGYLAIEHSNLQGDVVRELFLSAGFRAISTEVDLVGRDRFTQGFIP
jgi:release factor glutamine methyltransferase